jgi:hypothetical protein
MDLVRQVLDEQVLDRREEYMGKVDGIVLEMRDDGPPRVAFLEIGAPALARRFSPLLGDWIAALARHLGVSDGEPLRVPPARVLEWDVDIKLDLDARDTSAMAWEHWVEDRIVRRIPGSGASSGKSTKGGK